MQAFKAALLTASLALAGILPAAQAQSQTIRIGVITSLSGPAAESGAQMKAGIETYLRTHGDTVAGRKIEMIYKDDTGAQPDVAKRLATELLSRDKVDVLAGFVFTPNAMAAAGVADQAKKPMVIMNAAASGITSRSPAVTRVSYTIAQSVVPLAEWAYKTGSRRVFTVVSDYAPGLEAETWFNKTFTAAGGQIVGSVRMPLATTDYSAFVQRIKDEKPDAVHVFLPNGQPMVSFTKAYRDKGLDKAGIRFLGGEGWGDEDVLSAGGDTLVGIYSAGFYSFTRPGAENAKFVDAFSQTVGGKFKPSFLAAASYDGMALIARTLEKTKGNADVGPFMDALKGYTAPSPRGSVSIDPGTRDIVQTIYIRRIDKAGGKLVATEIDKYDGVKDPAK
ncbi:branched-chain amino acid transport system substrate-binding protein [Noviherbaspirillum humi]|uniref:Branched-chain amino acid transport system substrate-binding protein n=1 Tax=Noviherbaspirillum humi TaxID=1688639 RepID=A0A239IDY3_9BURK|nr:ABC transporter substrate-binding protein [Noviherbaspirillum humi]SNS91771.1 branched-chain amino acid transport system substrate-binding protein [Noviherbaspirillum humi]